MKICILTPRFPFPENGGDVLRINNIARYLKSQGHHLVLISYYDYATDESLARMLYDNVYLVKRNKWISALNSLRFMLHGKPIQCGYYYSKRFQRTFAKVVESERPERYVAHLLRMAPYLEQHALYGTSVVEMTDALSKTYAMATRAKGFSLKKLIYKAERYLIKRYERHVVEYFPKVVLVSQGDVDFLKGFCPKSDSLCVHTNGVDMFTENATYDADKICFIGNMRTLQNQDAALFFAKEIFPLIKHQRSNAKFYIIGAQPSKEIENLATTDSSIVVTGFVDNLYSVVKDSCVAVAPVRIAAGIQNKVLVAMAMSVPVVLTDLISKAIPELKHGKNCYIANAAQEIANYCINLMQHPQERQHMSVEAFHMVRAHYSWEEKLNGYINKP